MFFVKLINILPIDTLTNMSDISLVRLFLEGDPNLSLDTNKKLFDAVQSFIHDSKRFKPLA